MKKRLNLNSMNQEKLPGKLFEELDPIELLRFAEKGQFGNRHDYYAKRGVNLNVIDSRILSLDDSYFYNKNVLDIGCHSGIATLQIAKNYHPKKIKGIDIDYQLINHAVKNWAKEERIEEIEGILKSKTDENLTQQVEKLKSFPKNIKEKDSDRFSNSLLKKRETSEMNIETTDIYPKNVQFELSNILDYPCEKGCPKYDVIVCLSLTKWIHLNYGDKGIKDLFQKIKNLLSSKGVLILEYQKFKSYNKKAKEFKRFKGIIGTIELFPENFEDYLVKDLGF